ncbi:MAG: ZIP family metal transporter [Candidatus Pacearchaeota archaeon]|jgi:zinc and cadmium transporter
MKEELLYTLYSVIIVSLISFTGILFLINRKKFFQKFLMILVAFAAGTMLATVFFDLIPESFEELQNYYFIIIGILFFFVLESLIHWHHDHSGTCEGCLHPYVYLNLIGDAIHNFLDGIIIASGFLISIPSGIAVSIAIIFHEIPQEIGDFAVLVHGGFSKTKALFYNFLSATTAILGALIGYFALSNVQNLTPYIIAIAAGGFIYIAISDLFPELHKEKDLKKKLIQIGFLILGIILVGVVLI